MASGIDGAAGRGPGFDPAALLEYVENDEDLARDLAGVFVAEVPARLDGLQAALEEGDLEAACLLAHAVKGMAWAVCASDLAAGAARMEELANERRARELEALFPEFLDQTGQLLQRIRDWLGPGRSPIRSEGA
jgi:HPt (histidine-containing phosphotransfer) domain-containing protein